MRQSHVSGASPLPLDQIAALHAVAVAVAVIADLPGRGTVLAKAVCLCSGHHAGGGSRQVSRGGFEEHGAWRCVAEWRQPAQSPEPGDASLGACLGAGLGCCTAGGPHHVYLVECALECIGTILYRV